MEKLVSEGKCSFCGKTYKQQGIAKHLLVHLEKEVAGYNSKKRGLSYLIKAYADEMFLMLWVDGQTTYEEIDDFLRSIWLECCGHMSNFVDPKQKTNRAGSIDFNLFSIDDYVVPGEIRKDTPVYKTYSKNKRIQYDYDFGSTTRLDVVLIEQIEIPAPESIVLLSRNEPLKIMCHNCGKKPAVKICSIHLWDDNAFFCEDCVKIHEKECEDFADYASLPVVNSPRMGICAYEGGEIDLERDVIYLEKQIHK